MKKKIFVEQLTLGMYVNELDRPWLETPFLFQGFPLESNAQIKELKQCCEYVYIDPMKGIEGDMLPQTSITNNNLKSPITTPKKSQSPKAFSNKKNRKPAQPVPQNAVLYHDKITVKEELGRAERVRHNGQDIIKTIIQDIRNERILDVGTVKSSVDEMVESIVRNPDALLLLTQLKDKDTESYGQAIDVSVYLLAFGRHLGFPKQQLRMLGLGGLLQDIGKVRLSVDLLRKKEKLSKEEHMLVESHVLHSIDILNNTPGIDPEVVELVATHHERQDGSGYPNGLTGEYIGTFGNMAGIVDSFIALTKERPYAAPVSPREALEIMSAWRGKYLHGGLMERFIQCIGIYPVGSLVELNTGEVGVVLSQNRVYHFKPKIIRILDAKKKPYKNPSVLDLYDDPRVSEDMPYRIEKSLEYGMYGIDPKEYYL